MKEPVPLTKQLAPLIVCIVLIIVLTLIIHGSRLPENNVENQTSGEDVKMRLSPFSYTPGPARTAASHADLNLPDPDTM